MNQKNEPGQKSAQRATDPSSYPADSIDLRKMNRAMRHRLRNLCAGVKMTIERISDTLKDTHPNIVGRCAVINNEMNTLQLLTERMDLLFDTLPKPCPKTLFEILSNLRERFIKDYPLCNFGLEGEESGICFIKGSWIETILLELLQNAGEAAGADGRIVLAWHMAKDGIFSFEITNDGAPIPPEIPLDPPQPFHTMRSRHDGIGLSIAYRICKEGNMELKLHGGGNNPVSTATIFIPAGEYQNGDQ